MAGLLVGNILALFVSSFVCFFAWQATHPEFFDELLQYNRARKERQKKSEEPADQKKQKDSEAGVNPDPKEQSEAEAPLDKDQQASQKTDQGKKDPEIAGQNDVLQPPLKKPEFPITVIGLTILIDAAFCALAGYVCVIIAGFAKNNHGMLMALFIVVWKVQQLVSFVENQLPASLVGVEVIVLPIACIFGASMAGENDTVIEEEDGEGEGKAEGRDKAEGEGKAEG